MEKPIHYSEIKPSAPLNKFVKCFWVLEKKYEEANPFESVYPDGCIDLIFSNSDSKLTSFVVGQQMTRIDIPQSGIVKSIGVRFFSFGAYLFLSTPINSLTHSIVELESILKKDASELSERIFSTDIKTAIRIIEQFLLKKLISHDHKIDQVKSATDLLYKHNGNYLIETLADQVNASPRTLERKFEITTGLSPKSFARIIRFNKIRNALTLNPDIDLTSLAFEYNHFDQAHFIKDFKSFAGITPSEFIKAVKAGRAAFNKK